MKDAGALVCRGAMAALDVPGTAAYLGRLGFPQPQVMAVVAVAIETVGGLALILGWKTRLFASVLVLYVLVATRAAHRFWEHGGAERTSQMQHFFKNLAIMGGLLYVALEGAGRASLDRR